MSKRIVKKIILSIVSIGVVGMNSTVFANSGGYETEQGDYIGLYPSGSNVVLDKEITGTVYGAKSDEGTLSNNIVTVNAGNKKSVGAYIIKGDALNNKLIINSGTDIDLKDCYGAIVETGKAIGNEVIVDSAKIDYTGIIFGAEVSVSGSAINNRVICNNGIINTGIRGGSVTKGDASDNLVVINDGEVNGAIYGATSNNGNLYGNGVIINGGTLNYGDIIGAHTFNGIADGNYVVINNGNFYYDIMGAKVVSGDVINNKVFINGGKIEGWVYGGYTDDGYASGNSIIVSGDADLSKAKLYAGYSGEGDGKNLANTIKLNGWSGSVASINNTDVIEINGSKLTENGIINITEGNIDDLKNTTIKVNSIVADSSIKQGDTLQIIKGNTNLGINHDNIEISDDGILGGIATSINGQLAVDDNGNLSFVVDEVHASKQTKMLTETRAATAAFVGQGADVISDSMIVLADSEEGINTFASITGNNTKFKTGSHVDINGWNGIIGIANTKMLDNGKLSYGAFFENGSGNYATFNEQNNMTVRGDGSAVYNGGGLALRMDRADGTYFEGSVRGGSVKNEIDRAVTDGNNVYGFKTENAYYGVHVGIGKIIELENGKAWDIYGKYFHTYNDGDSVVIAGDRFDFDSVTSDRLRVGFRMLENKNTKLSNYFGLAYEYEFNGDAEGSAAGYAMDTPSLKGSSVLAEVGFRYKPGKDCPWYFDMNLKGYAGTQQGYSGNVQAVYSF